MPTCPRCTVSFDAEELTRHDRNGVVHVHCPECGCHLGDYNSHAR